MVVEPELVLPAVAGRLPFRDVDFRGPTSNPRDSIQNAQPGTAG